MNTIREIIIQNIEKLDEFELLEVQDYTEFLIVKKERSKNTNNTQLLNEMRRIIEEEPKVFESEEQVIEELKQFRKERVGL